MDKSVKEMLLGRKILEIVSQLRRRMILQNYAWMTAVNMATPLIGLLLYPYVIRKTGTEAYGLFVFAQFVIMYAVQLVSFGLDLHPSKIVAQNKDNDEVKNMVVTHVLALKLMLCVVVCAVFVPLVWYVPIMSENKAMFLWSLLFVGTEVFNMQFYYQGVGKMRVMSLVALAFKLLMIPAVFLCIRTESDNVKYMIITGGTMFGGALCNLLWMIGRYGVRFTSLNLGYARELVRDAMPFFWSYVFGQFGTSTLVVLTGAFLSITDVAIFDLGNKILNVLRNFTISINTALFPEVVGDAREDKVRKIFRYEGIIALGLMAVIVVGGYPAVLIMGGDGMAMAYPVLLILSFTLYTHLRNGAYEYFVFVPAKRYNCVLVKHIIGAVCCLSLFVALCRGMQLWLPVCAVLSIPMAMSLSELIELVYYRYASKEISKNKAD